VKVNAVHLLLFVAVASPLLALLSTGQDPAWTQDVDKACRSPRMQLRIAASGKVAKAGGAAVPAVRAFMQKNGAAMVPQILVEAFADDAPADAATLQLLVDWANDRDFYWRAAAMRGIATRANGAGDRSDELRALLRSFHDDPAWLMRTHARFGSVLAGDAQAAALPEDDPRAHVRLPILLLSHGVLPPLQPLIDALVDERTFLDVPWGKRLGEEAHRALKAWLGDAHPLANGGSFPDQETGVRLLIEACRKKSGQDLAMPVARRDAGLASTGWIELLSCKHGDQYVQWNAAGEVRFGIDASSVVKLPAATWQKLDAARAQLVLRESLGEVICDSVRFSWPEPKLHSRAAPASLPAPAAQWLQQLAQAVEEAGDSRHAVPLRAAIEQFAAR
jgi:hypothetical protein